MMAPPSAYFEALLYIAKDLEKSGRVSTRAEHNNYFSISKACYCSAYQIHGFSYYCELAISRAILSKSLIDLI